MSWRDRLQRAVYNGVSFGVTAHEFEAGRSGVVHEFPQRETPFVEDQGRRARRFRVVGFVLGDDYFDRRDKLIAACERRSLTYPLKPGKLLIHPYLGRVRVFCQRVRVREEVGDGRIARFDMTFVETGFEARVIEARADPVARVDTAAEAVGESITDSVEGNLITKGSETIRAASAAAITATGELLRGLDVFSGPAAEVAALAASVETLIGTASSLATAPADLVGTLLVSIDGVRAAAENAVDAFYAYQALFGSSPESDPGGGATTLAANANAALLAAAARQAAAAGAARAAVRAAWPSLEQADEARGDLLEEIDRLLELEATTDSVLGTLTQLRAAVAAGVPRDRQRLPRRERIVLPATLPAAILAYRVHDDPARDREVLEQNQVGHPLFVPGGEELVVLVRP